MLGYPRETVAAEKFEALTKLSLLNSRMKDYYDLGILSLVVLVKMKVPTLPRQPLQAGSKCR